MTTPLAPEEKSTLVMVYTQNALIRGEVVTRENVRVSIWLRTDGAPHFFHFLNANMLSFGGGSAKSSNHSEIYVPVASVIGFHIAPPAQDSLDYEERRKIAGYRWFPPGWELLFSKGKFVSRRRAGLAPALKCSPPGCLCMKLRSPIPACRKCQPYLFQCCSSIRSRPLLHYKASENKYGKYRCPLSGDF